MYAQQALFSKKADADKKGKQRSLQKNAEAFVYASTRFYQLILLFLP
jgi:hypothetical protein